MFLSSGQLSYYTTGKLRSYGHAVDSAPTAVGPTVWNSLPDELRDPARSFDSFRQFLKTILLAFTSVTSALEVFLNGMRYINPRFTYLLTYLYMMIVTEGVKQKGSPKKTWWDCDKEEMASLVYVLSEHSSTSTSQSRPVQPVSQTHW